MYDYTLEDEIAALKAQRNIACDDLAKANAVILGLQRKIAEFPVPPPKKKTRKS